MRRPFSELRSKMSPESQARAKARTDEMLREMRLSELRRARDLTQQELASELGVNQAWISKVERQTDMYLSTLRSYIEAIGGKLEIVARFDDAAIRISQLDELITVRPERQEAVTSVTVPSQMNIPVYEAPRHDSPRLEPWQNRDPHTTGRSYTTTTSTTSTRTPTTSKAA